ncbi:hypothetical protein M9H77_26702 [Catharanthus roseus]|uniref:Uncharacterized protein n=1 Tax=Catharanthus roseus TaxID=4058 RepID=A0ACC0AAR2_CATRO|nr:hypothetical protein M9H77_26702 [Catharanthus roseus]
MVVLFTNTYEKPHSDQGINSGYDLVFENVRGLHCTWLVPHTRAFFDGVDDSNLGEWIHLKRGVDRGGCGPIVLCGHSIMLCVGISSERSGAQQATEVLGKVMFHCGAYNLVFRGTQMPYSATVDLVAGLAVSQFSIG